MRRMDIVGRHRCCRNGGHCGVLFRGLVAQNPGVAKNGAVINTEYASIVSKVQKIILAGAAVVLFNLMLLIVFGDNGLVELSRLRAREQALSGQNETLARENVSLYRTIGRLKNDPVYIESVARNELGMVGKNDVVILRPVEKE